MSLSSLPRDGSGSPIQVGRPKADSTQTLSYTATKATTGSSFSAERLVRLYATTLCHVEISPTADADIDTNSMPLGAGAVEYFYVKSGDFISAVRNASDGSLYITEMD